MGSVQTTHPVESSSFWSVASTVIVAEHPGQVNTYCLVIWEFRAYPAVPASPPKWPDPYFAGD